MQTYKNIENMQETLKNLPYFFSNTLTQSIS